MSTANEPAFPIVASTGDPRDGVYCANGLTKREYFAAIALNGLASSQDDRVKTIADQAVAFADALLAALEENK